MVLFMNLLNTACMVVQAVCLVVIAFELNPWVRKNDGKQ